MNDYQQITLPIVLFLILGYMVFTIGDVKAGSDSIYPDYNDHVVPFLETCSLTELPERPNEKGDPSLTRSPLKWYSICASYQIFNNENVIPFLFSIGLLPLVFHLGYRVSGNSSIVGMIALLIVVSSSTFYKWDTSATYDQSWAFFLFLALNMLYWKPRLMPVAFFASVVSKGLTLAYLPMLLYHMWVEWQQYKNPMWVLASSLFIIIPIAVVVAVLYSTNQFGIIGASLSFNLAELIEGFWIWIFYFGDIHVQYGIPLVIVILVILRNKIHNADVIGFWMVGILATVPLILGFTDQLIHPYRFVPLLAFFGIGLGMITKHYFELALFRWEKSRILNGRTN